jgi:type VI secretion system protein VasD
MHKKSDARQVLFARRRWLPVCIKHGRMALAWIPLVACGTLAQVTTGKVAEVALGAIGINLQGKPDSEAKTVALRLEGARNLNAGENGQGLATVVRLYQLRNQHTFLATPYANFGAPEKEQQAMGTDLLDVRELILSPGQIFDLKEKMSGEAEYLGVVALFRVPAPRRWRFAFAAADAARSGVTVGVHTCAMTATALSPVGMTLADAALLSSVKCR